MIPGIGNVRRKELIKKFGSIKKMKEASLNELKEILPHDAATNLYEYFRNKED